MAITVYPVNAVGGEPTYDAREVRQSLAALMLGATDSRRLGARSGVRAGTPDNTVEATTTEWTVHPHAGIIDKQATDAPYLYSLDADETGPIDAADGSNPRIDIITARIDDPAAGDGSAVPAVVIGYKAGTAAASPVAPTPDTTRELVIAHINLPASGGGSPTTTLVAPRFVAAGGIVPVRTATERNQLASAVGQCVVLRANATAGRELEYTMDGTTWRVVDNYDTGWVTLANPAGFTGTIRYRQVRSAVSVEVNLTGTIATGQVQIASGIIPSAQRPTNSSSIAGAWFDNEGGMAAITTGGSLIVKNYTGGERSSIAATFSYFV